LSRIPGGAEASLRDVLAAALDANREMARLAAELREENGRLREENARLRAEGAEQAAELERVRAAGPHPSCPVTCHHAYRRSAVLR
jgi:anti-sigma factor RsiW